LDYSADEVRNSNDKRIFSKYTVLIGDQITNDTRMNLSEVIDITTEDVNFDEMEQDIARFASEPSVRSVLELGVDLQNYSSQIAKELEETENSSIEDYLRQIPRVEKLHSEISSCDQALAAMEDLLVQFKGSLGQLSADICSLQSRSQEITVKLENRKNLEKYLGEFTNELNISKEFADKVSSGEINGGYTKVINELNSKLRFVKRNDVRHTIAVQETKGKMDQLKTKASDNIKKWIVLKVNELKDKFYDDQLSIQNSMMRFRSLMKFLKENSPETEQTCRDYYVDALSRVYLDNFRIISKGVLKKMAQISTYPETIIPQQTRSLFKKRSYNESTLFFSLGERVRLLNDILAPPQEFGEGSYPLEALMRSLYQTLIDSVTSEHVFASEFFDDDNIATHIFSSTSKYLEQFIDDLFSRVSDPICIALLLRFNIAQKAEMERRRVFKIDQHLANVNNKLIARFRTIVNQNIAVIESADPKLFLDNEATAHHANSMTKRFSEFAVSISMLMINANSEILIPEIHSVSAAIMDMLERVSREFRTEELSIVFLINNYYLILSTLRSVEGCFLIDLFEQKLGDCTEQFVELQLRTHFKELYDTIRRCFARLDNAEPIQTNIGERELKEIATEFKERHVEKVKIIAEGQIMRFGDFMNGREIMMQLAKRLVLFWAKFDQLCKSVIRTGQIPSWLSSLISPQQVVLNIRPFTESFC